MTATHYESHAWGSGVDGDECVACGVTWQDCDEDCTRRPAPAHRAHTGMTTHENGDQTVNAMTEEERQGLTIWGETIAAQMRTHALIDDDLNVIGSEEVLILHIRDDAPRSPEDSHPAVVPPGDVAKLRELLNEAAAR